MVNTPGGQYRISGFRAQLLRWDQARDRKHVYLLLIFIFIFLAIFCVDFFVVVVVLDM